MIDPINFTNYDLDEIGLQEYALFAIAAAGKNAMTSAKLLEKLLNHVFLRAGGVNHFDSLNRYKGNLHRTMREIGFGCHQLKSRGFAALAKSGLNLKTCTPQDLEALPAIGPKTSRFFILHTRRNAQVACLDVHILRWLGRQGCEAVPEQTPSSYRQYLRLESEFLRLCEERGRSPAELDLDIWNSERGTAQYLINAK